MVFKYNISLSWFNINNSYSKCNVFRNSSWNQLVVILIIKLITPQIAIIKKKTFHKIYV